MTPYAADRTKTILMAICFFAAVIFITLALWPAPARSEPAPSYPCPTPAPCKIITLDAQEEQALTGPNLIFDLAEWANRASMSGLVAAWRRKIEAAPRGTPAVVQDPSKEPAK